jgi:hypothetical protein
MSDLLLPPHYTAALRAAARCFSRRQSASDRQMREERPADSKMFLIVAGAITAVFLPFAIAFPPTLLAKAAAVTALVAVAAAVSALLRRRRK